MEPLIRPAASFYFLSFLCSKTLRPPAQGLAVALAGVLCGGQNAPVACRKTKRPVPQVVPAGATGPQVQGRAGPGRSRRSETPQDDYHNGRACVFGTGPAVLLQAVRPRFWAAAFGWGWGLLRLCSRLAGKRKPRPGLGVAAFSPKQPAARRRRWRRAHFGTTGLKACPFAACLSFCARCLLPLCGWGVVAFLRLVGN